MPNFNEIINENAKLIHFAGAPDSIIERKDPEVVRKSLIDAMCIRQDECELRFKITSAILVVALGTLIYFVLFQPAGLEKFKQLMSILGGGSIIGLLVSIISMRDEITKIKQTLVIVPALDSAALATLLLTLSSK